MAFLLAFWAIYPFHHHLPLPFSLYDLFIPWYKSCFLRLFDLARGIQKNLVDCILHKKRGQFGEIKMSFPGCLFSKLVAKSLIAYPIFLFGPCFSETLEINGSI